MDEIIIRLSHEEGEGVHYYIYPGHDAYMECDSEDGGISSTIEDALDMAIEDTKAILKRKA